MEGSPEHWLFVDLIRNEVTCAGSNSFVDKTFLNSFDVIVLGLRFLSRLWPILQVVAHHIQDKLAVSFDSSSIGLISYKWFLTIGAKYISVKTYNEENQVF